MATIKWGYAVNQWRNLEVDLVRKDQMESAFKVISVCGFNGIEITDTAIGTHDYIPGLFGSVRNFMNFLNDCGVERVCSFFYGYYRGSPLNPADHGKLAEEAGRKAEFIAQLGASRFVARPMGPYFKEAPITDDKIKTVGECWSKVGEATKRAGVETAHALGLPVRHSQRERHRQASRSGRIRRPSDSPWTQRS